jgi:hypothetical protein
MKLVLLVVCTLPVVAAHAQGGRGAAQAAALEAQLQGADAQGAANANRPGDEDLTCQQLQDEIVAAAQSPEFQGALQPFAEQAQADQAQVEEAQQQIEEQTQGRRRGGAGGGLFRSLAQGAAAAALPNSVGASATQAAGMAQAAQMQRQAAQNQERIFAAAEGAVGLMGTAQRGQRVMELAEAKKCEWLNGDPLSTPAAAPEPQPERGRR